MNPIVRSIPNTVTTCNLLSGCVAIILAFRGADILAWNLPAWKWSCIFIAAAAVFDFLDGLCARALKAYSEVGKELDSLCDLVSFGVAPAMVMLNTLQANGGEHWINWAVLLIPAMGALRLARFNVRDAGETQVFRGLPIPANAIFWMGMVSWIWKYGYPGAVTTTIIIVMVSLLMVSNLPLLTLKFKTYAVGPNIRRYMLIAGCIFLVYANGMAGLAWTVLLYLLLSAGFNKHHAGDK